MILKCVGWCLRLCAKNPDTFASENNLDFNFTLLIEMLKITGFEAGNRLHFYVLLPNRCNAAAAFATPSGKPTACASSLASSYRRRASARSPSISANSPRLCVATAQPTSHSSLRSGGWILAAMAIALIAHARALAMSAEREARGWPATCGGSCCAREMERLFTGKISRED